MSDEISRKPPARMHGRPLERGRSGVASDERRAGRSDAADTGRPFDYIHLGNWAKLAQFATGLIVGSSGANGAFATASAASGGPCRLRTRAPRDGHFGPPRISRPRQRAG
jgi:hypothetical protein